MDSAHPDFIDQLHRRRTVFGAERNKDRRRGAADRQRGFKALSALPSVSDPVRPAGREGGTTGALQNGHSLDGRFSRSPLTVMSSSLFWLAAPLLAIAALVALEIQYRREEDGHGRD